MVAHIYVSVASSSALQGDVIGCLLHLGKGGRPFEKERSVRDSSWNAALQQRGQVAIVVGPFVRPDVQAIVIHTPVLQDIVTWKGSLYFKEDPSADQPGPLAGSIIAFTKNGKSQGAAYRLAVTRPRCSLLLGHTPAKSEETYECSILCRDIKEGTYYPALSIYTFPDQKEGASVAVNFGPAFKFSPIQLEGYPEARPVFELAGKPPSAASASGAPPNGAMVVVS